MAEQGIADSVRCPLCKTDVSIAYQGGMSFAPGLGLASAVSVEEGTCAVCGALVVVTPMLNKGTISREISASRVPRTNEGTQFLMVTESAKYVLPAQEDVDVEC